MGRHQKFRPGRGKNRKPPDPELFSVRFLVRMEEERPGIDDRFCQEARANYHDWRGIHSFIEIRRSMYRNDGASTFSPFRQSGHYGISIIDVFMRRWCQLKKIHEVRYGKSGGTIRMGGDPTARHPLGPGPSTPLLVPRKRPSASVQRPTAAYPRIIPPAVARSAGDAVR